MVTEGISRQKKSKLAQKMRYVSESSENINPLAGMPILGSSNSAANKDMMSKVWKNGFNYMIEYKTLWEKEKLFITSNFFFSDNVFKSCLSLMHQYEYLWSKRLREKRSILVQVYSILTNQIIQYFLLKCLRRKFACFYSSVLTLP